MDSRSNRATTSLSGDGDMTAIDEFFRHAVPVTRETTAAAASRYGLQAHTLYRRLIRAVERGEIAIGPADRVGPTIFLLVETWDWIVQATRKPGRPRKQ